ncbi:MAG: endonuclease domain-containing protein [Erythrobacter sp.]|nr:endonuclease domain-containing protein [Erythrobacter sp.]
MAQAKAPSSSEEGVGGGGPTHQQLLERAAEMRRNPTAPEYRLWLQLRGSRLHGCKFRRQTVIGQRIVDFFCPAKGLVIEVDGDTHDPVADALRDQRLLEQHGFATIRFTNLDVMQNLEGVLLTVTSALQATGDRWRGRHHPPTPSSEEEGE